MSQFALLKVGALKAVFPFYYKIACLQFDQMSCLGQEWVQGGGSLELGQVR